MQSAVCTLFEGNYHFGVVALINSLYLQGYRGDVYAGYKGDLPAWLMKAEAYSSETSPELQTIKVRDDLYLHLVSLQTNYHLTNYKPNFMMDILDGPAKDLEAIFYFDPDIVVTGPWRYFEQWVKCGVALCEDIHSPKEENHPRRIAWKRYFERMGTTLKFKSSIYVNGGFIGVYRDNFCFLSTWKKMQEEMASAIGGLNRSSLPGSSLPEHANGEFDPFPKSDQDALNCCIEAWEGTVSYMGKDGMAFKQGINLMSHAVGPIKPWNWKPIKQFINGNPPRRVDKDYWKHTNWPLQAHSKSSISYKSKLIKLASFFGRFYVKPKTD